MNSAKFNLLAMQKDSKKKIDKSTVSEHIIQQLQNLILKQKFSTGDKLPPERVLAEMLGVSRPSVREALKSLETLGIVEIKHGSGVYISRPDFDFITFPISVLLSKESDKKDILKELIETREIVDVEIAALSACRANIDDIRQLEQLLIKRESKEEMIRLNGEYNNDFEILMGEIAQNSILLSVQKATHKLWETVLKKLDNKLPDVHVINAEHRQIFEAIRLKDEQAARRAMIYHLRSPLRNYK